MAKLPLSLVRTTFGLLCQNGRFHELFFVTQQHREALPARPFRHQLHILTTEKRRLKQLICSRTELAASHPASPPTT